jgi:hypothetical protein
MSPFWSYKMFKDLLYDVYLHGYVWLYDCTFRWFINKWGSTFVDLKQCKKKRKKKEVCP